MHMSAIPYFLIVLHPLICTITMTYLTLIIILIS
jgi:hypothetical protein